MAEEAETEGEDGTLLGFALGALSSDHQESYLHDLWVAPEHRGHGVGHALMDHYLAVSLELGASRVSLVTKGAARYYDGVFGFGREQAWSFDDLYVSELERHRGFCVLAGGLAADGGSEAHADVRRRPCAHHGDAPSLCGLAPDSLE